MDINGTGRIDRTRGSVKGRPASGAGGASFALPADDAPKPAALSAAAPLTALDSLLALQSVDDAVSGRSKGLAHGNSLLDMLDELRDGLLAGAMPRATLHRLAGAVAQRQNAFADPALQGVLDEIELRAHVELAKLEVAERAAA